MNSRARRSSWLLFGIIAAVATFTTNAYARSATPRWALPLAGFAIFAICAGLTGWLRQTGRARSAFNGGAAVGLLSGIALIIVASLSGSGTFLRTSAWASGTLDSTVIAPTILLTIFGIFVAGGIAAASAYLTRRWQPRRRG